MPKTSSDFTPEQRKAVESAPERWPTRKVHAAAVAGELEVPAFKVSLSTVATWRAEAERARAAAHRSNAPPRANLDDLEHEGIEVLRDALDEIKARAKDEGKTNLSDMRAWTAAYKNLRQSYAEPLRRRGGKTEDEPGQDVQTPTPLLTRLSQGGASSSTDDGTEGEAA